MYSQTIQVYEHYIFCKPFDDSVFVFKQSSFKIICHARIQNLVIPICEHIHIIKHKTHPIDEVTVIVILNAVKNLENNCLLSVNSFIKLPAYLFSNLYLFPSSALAAAFISLRISMLCGQWVSHLPQAMQSLAGAEVFLETVALRYSLFALNFLPE